MTPLPTWLLYLIGMLPIPPWAQMLIEGVCQIILSLPWFKKLPAIMEARHACCIAKDAYALNKGISDAPVKPWEAPLQDWIKKWEPASV